MDLLISLFILIGAFFMLAGSVALIRFPDFFTRTHGPTKATTIGVSSIVLAALLFFIIRKETGAITELLIIVFLFITAPTAAHLMAKAGIFKKIPMVENTLRHRVGSKRRT